MHEMSVAVALFLPSAFHCQSWNSYKEKEEKERSSLSQATKMTSQENSVRRRREYLPARYVAILPRKTSSPSSRLIGQTVTTCRQHFSFWTLIKVGRKLQKLHDTSGDAGKGTHSLPIVFWCKAGTRSWRRGTCKQHSSLTHKMAERKERVEKFLFGSIFPLSIYLSPCASLCICFTWETCLPLVSSVADCDEQKK